VEVAARKSAEGSAQAQLARLELLNHKSRAIGEASDLAKYSRWSQNLEEHLPVDVSCVCLYDGRAGSFDCGPARASKGRPLAEKLPLRNMPRIPIGENGLSHDA